MNLEPLEYFMKAAYVAHVVFNLILLNKFQEVHEPDALTVFTENKSQPTDVLVLCSHFDIYPIIMYP